MLNSSQSFFEDGKKKNRWREGAARAHPSVPIIGEWGVPKKIVPHRKQRILLKELTPQKNKMETHEAFPQLLLFKSQPLMMRLSKLSGIKS